MRKSKLADLAIFGGTPAFAEPLHVGRPNIGDREKFMTRVSEALDRRWLTNDGPFVRELEAKIAEYVGVEHCVAMCNATVGMEVLIRALDLTGEVIVPAFTFIATAHAVAWLGLQPVFCDVDPRTHTLDPNDVARIINPSTSAILGVHLWGNVCDDAGLRAQAARHGAKLIYDAAHAFSCDVAGKRVGSFGDAEIFSFHATKFFNTLEGGAVTTNDASLARELRLRRNFGFAGYDAVATVGTNAKMNELSAAMGLTSFEALDDLLAVNAERFGAYADAIRDIDSVQLVAPANVSNKQYVVLEVNDDAGLTRDQLLAVLWAENIRARRYFFPGCDRVPPYDTPERRSLPVTDRLVSQVLVMPAGGAVSDADVGNIVDLMRWLFAHAEEVARKLPAVLPPGGLQ